MEIKHFSAPIFKKLHKIYIEQHICVIGNNSSIFYELRSCQILFIIELAIFIALLCRCWSGVRKKYKFSCSASERRKNNHLFCFTLKVNWCFNCSWNSKESLPRKPFKILFQCLIPCARDFSSSSWEQKCCEQKNYSNKKWALLIWQ